MNYRGLKTVKLEARYGDGLPWGLRSAMNAENYALMDSKMSLEQAMAAAHIKAVRWGETVRDGAQFRVVVS